LRSDPETARELKARGVEFVIEPKRMPYGTTSIFKDVDGNCLLQMNEP